MHLKYRHGIVFSLILAPIRSGLRGFCLFILEIFSMDYQQKNPLKYYAMPFLFEFTKNGAKVPILMFIETSFQLSQRDYSL